MNKYTYIIVIFLSGCGINCEQSNRLFIDDGGSFRIKGMTMHRPDYGTLRGNHGENMFFIPDLVNPEIGDSVYKEKGTATYIYVKKEYSYAQYLSCKDDYRVLNIKKWKNGDSIDIESIIH